jgi:sporulation protein YlmC with PRC-barrel domain
MLASEIEDKEVIDARGVKFGKVTDLELDEKDWRVKSLGVELDKDVAEAYDLKKRFRKTHVLVNNEHIQAVGDHVILKGTNADLLKLLASSPTSPPSTTTPPSAPPSPPSSSSPNPPLP